MRKKNFYYVLVLEDKPRFVTSAKNEIAHWNEFETPKEFQKEDALYIAQGLNINGHKAYVVYSSFEIDCRPYL